MKYETIITKKGEVFDVNGFKNYKYAIPISEVTDGRNVITTYRCTPYTVDDYIYGDEDYEHESFENEMY